MFKKLIYTLVGSFALLLIGILFAFMWIVVWPLDLIDKTIRASYKVGRRIFEPKWRE